MNENVPTRLKRLRESAGLSIRALAELLGRSGSGYAHYERPDRFKDPFLPMDLAPDQGGHQIARPARARLRFFWRVLLRSTGQHSADRDRHDRQQQQGRNRPQQPAHHTFSSRHDPRRISAAGRRARQLKSRAVRVDSQRAGRLCANSP